jgi:DNA adenine methylase
MKKENLKYPGQTTLSSMLPKILGLIPEHSQYWEMFCGTCQLFLNKNSVPSVLVDKNSEIVKASLPLGFLQGSCSYLPADVFEVLESLISSWEYKGVRLFRDAFIYLDPPWRFDLRGSKVPLYEFELSDNDHARLLLLIRRLPVKVAILHYTDPFYDDILCDWRRYDMKVSFRGRLCLVSLYCNFDYYAEKPAVISAVGLNKTDRQRIKRKAISWVTELKALPVYERHAIITAIKREFENSGVLGMSFVTNPEVLKTEK